MARSALLFGILNAAVAYLTARVFKAELPRYRAIRLRALIVLSGPRCRLRLRRPHLLQSRTKLFRRPRRLSKPLSLTNGSSLPAGKTTPAFMINGNLQFSSRDEARYHEAPRPARHADGFRCLPVSSSSAAATDWRRAKS